MDLGRERFDSSLWECLWRSGASRWGTCDTWIVVVLVSAIHFRRCLDLRKWMLYRWRSPPGSWQFITGNRDNLKRYGSFAKRAISWLILLVLPYRTMPQPLLVSYWDRVWNRTCRIPFVLRTCFGLPKFQRAGNIPRLGLLNRKQVIKANFYNIDFFHLRSSGFCFWRV